MKKLILMMAVSACLVSCGDDKKDDDPDKNGDGKISSKDMDSETISEAREKCIKGLQDAMDKQFADKADAMSDPIEEFCDCAVEKMVEADMSITEMMSTDQEKVKEVAGPCMEDFQKGIMEAVR